MRCKSDGWGAVRRSIILSKRRISSALRASVFSICDRSSMMVASAAATFLLSCIIATDRSSSWSLSGLMSVTDRSVVGLSSIHFSRACRLIFQRLRLSLSPFNSLFCKARIIELRPHFACSAALAGVRFRSLFWSMTNTDQNSDHMSNLSKKNILNCFASTAISVRR